MANPLEKDSRNYHILFIPKTNEARKKLNLASSRANAEGFYYKPRFFIEDLINNFDDDLYITTACIAGIVRDKDSYEQIFKPLLEHFKENMLLEVQPHDVDIQKIHNKRMVKLAKKYNLHLIAANDSHYIYPEQAADRAVLLGGKNINYGDEDNFILDYPEYETMYQRFKNQGVLSDEEILAAMKQTLIFDECENINLNKMVKMPTIYPDKTEDEKVEILKKKLNAAYKEMVRADGIAKDESKKYREEIHKEMKVIEETEVVHSADYFLFSKESLDLAIDKYGGILTNTSRGSAGAFLINKLLGITQIDRLKTNLPLYSERFMSTARLLENKSMPDIDFNIVDQVPFVKASRELLGEHGCYPMIAYGTMQESEAFRNVCRAKNIEFDKYNLVAKNLDKYRNDKKWKPIIDESQKFVGTIVSKSPHPCSHLIMNADIREEIGLIRIENKLCAMITSDEADEWKYLKHDFLLVSVWLLISETFKAIGIPTPTVQQLLDNLDDKVWKLFEDGITCTLNQVDSEWATSLVKKYKPKTVEELAMFVACIRPSFNSFRDRFINREPYTTGSKDLDQILAPTYHYILFQENLMQYFDWLGVSPAESIGLIKKISKKKIKPDDFKNLTERIKKQWIVNTGSEDGFDTIWADMQAAMGYGFNCITGNTKLRCIDNNFAALTVKEMHEIQSVKPNKDIFFSLNNDHEAVIVANNIEAITYAGVRKVYKLTTEGGRSICCTQNHKFPTPDGAKTLLKIRSGSRANSENVRIYVYTDDGVLKTERVLSVEALGYDSVYDISMCNPYHNYVIDNGIVTSNSPHGLAYALDCLYCAYLKANYPEYYYVVALNLYDKDEERTSRLIKELSYFDIKLSSTKFRYASPTYIYDKNTKTIYRGMSSIKYLNRKIARELNKLKDNNYANFIEVLEDINNKTSVDSRQLERLIKLDFFSEFGDINKLLTLNKVYQDFNGRKQFTKKEAKEAGIDILLEKYAGRITEKLYKDIDLAGFLSEYIKGLVIKPTTLADKIAYETEITGNVNTIIDGVPPSIAIVTMVNAKFKNKLIEVYRLGTGEYETMKVKGALFDSCPLKKGQLIKTIHSSQERKWKRDNNGKFYQIDEYETILKGWELISGSEIT